MEEGESKLIEVTTPVLPRVKWRPPKVQRNSIQDPRGAYLYINICLPSYRYPKIVQYDHQTNISVGRNVKKSRKDLPPESKEIPLHLEMDDDHTTYNYHVFKFYQLLPIAIKYLVILLQDLLAVSE